MQIERKLRVFHIIICLVVFFAIWSVRELIIRPVFLESLDGVVFGLAESAMKLLVWTFPAILMIRYFHADMWVGLKEMFTNKLQFRRDYIFLLVIILIPTVRFVQLWSATGELGLHSDFVPSRLIESVVFVGITEEIVFRGFLLNAFLKKMKMPYAVVLDAVLFTFIHYPIWIHNGFEFPQMLLGSISVAVISVGFAYSFIKTRNILVPMALHMVWNLSIHLFLGN